MTTTLTDWVELAAKALIHAITGPPPLLKKEFTLGYARMWIPAETLPAPPDGRAWGHVARLLVKRKVIETTGAYENDNYGAPKPIYRLCPDVHRTIYGQRGQTL